MEKGSKNDIYAYLDELSTDELKEILRTDYELELNDNSMVLYILGIIEKREATDCNTYEAWTEFQQYYNIPEGSNVSLYPCDKGNQVKKENKTLTVCFFTSRVAVAIVAMVFLFSGMVIAQASGIDVFGMLGYWTEETFHFIDKEQDVPGKEYALIETIKAALVTNGFAEGGDLALTWIPDDVTISAQEILSDEYSNTLHFAFQGTGDRFFSYDITYYQSTSQVTDFTFEKDNRSVECYTSGGRTFYILSNDDSLTATWTGTNGFNITISGNLKANEIKQIIDSIGEYKGG